MAELERVTVTFSAELDEVLKAYDEWVDAAESAANDAIAAVDKIGNSLKSFGETVSKYVTLPLAGISTAAALAADESITANTRLAASIRVAGGAVDTELAKFNELAAALQDLTTTEDDTVLQTAQVARSLGLSAQQSARAAKNAIALRAAFGVSEEAGIRLTSALEQGNTTMISRYLPSLRGIKDDSARAAEAQRLLANAFNIATEEAKVGLGPYRQLRNEIDDLLESFGTIVLDGLQPFVTTARRVVAAIQNLSPEAKKTAVTIAAIAAAVGPALIALSTIPRVVAFVATGLVSLATTVARTVRIVVSGVASIASALFSLPGLAVGAVVLAAVFRKTIAGMFEGLGNVIEKLFVNEIQRPLLLQLQFLRDALPAQGQALFDSLFGEIEIPTPVKDDLSNTISGVLNEAARQSGRDVEEFKRILSEKLASLGEGFQSLLPESLRKLFAELQEGFDNSSGAVSGTAAEVDDLIASLSNLGGAVDAATSEAIQKFDEFEKSVRTPKEALEATLKDLDELAEKARAAGIEASRVDEVVKRGNQQAIATFREADDAAKRASETARDLGLTFSSAFEDAVLEGKKVSEVLNGLAKDIARVALRQLVTQPLLNAAGGALSGVLGGVLGSAKGNAFRGGRLTPFAKGGVVTKPTVFPMAKGAGIMGEGGRAEGVLPLQRTSGGDLGVKASGIGGSAVQVNVYAPPGSSVTQERTRKGTDLEQINIMIDAAVADQIQKPGSKSHRALKRTFGATPQTTAR